MAGIYVKNITTGETLVSLNEKALLIPASTVKLLLSSVALKVLGPNHIFKTEFRVVPESLQDSFLDGHLYIKGGADSTLTREQLKLIVSQIKDMGITAVNGDIIYDASIFDEEVISSNTNARHYYAPSSGLTINDNKLILKGKGSHLKLPLSSSYLSLDFKGRYIDNPNQAKRPYMSVDIRERSDHFQIWGDATLADIQNQYCQVLISRPGLFCGTLVLEYLKQAGIQVRGDVRSGLTPERTTLLADIQSMPLSEIIRRLNQDSNNVIAKNLTKYIGHYVTNRQGSHLLGMEMIREHCELNLGLNRADYRLIDGVGLDKNNKVTAKAMARCLELLYQDQDIFGPFFESLVKQGTHPLYLEPKIPANLEVRIKSGTLSSTGVNALAGYIVDRDSSQWYSLVIFATRMRGNDRAYKGVLTNPILKKIVLYLANKDKTN